MNKHRLNILVNEEEYRLFNDIFKLARTQDETITKGDLFQVMLHCWLTITGNLYKNINNEKGEQTNGN